MQFDSNGLQLQSIAGNSGKAYKGLRSDGTPVFVKYEMPPIIPALAREQITPPVLATNREVGVGQRVEQEWLDGRTLTRSDMGKKAGPSDFGADALLKAPAQPSTTTQLYLSRTENFGGEVEGRCTKSPASKYLSGIGLQRLISSFAKLPSGSGDLCPWRLAP